MDEELFKVLEKVFNREIEIEKLNYENDEATIHDIIFLKEMVFQLIDLDDNLIDVLYEIYNIYQNVHDEKVKFGMGLVLYILQKKLDITIQYIDGENKKGIWDYDK